MSYKFHCLEKGRLDMTSMTGLDHSEISYPTIVRATSKYKRIGERKLSKTTGTSQVRTIHTKCS